MSETIVTLSGEDAELYKAFQRILDQQAKTDAGYAKIKKSSQDASKEAEKAAKAQEQADKKAASEMEKRERKVGDVVTGLGQMAVAYLSVSTAVSLVEQGMDAVVARQQSALEFAKALAVAQQEAAKNQAGASADTLNAQFNKVAPEIAAKTSFSDIPMLTQSLGAVNAIVGDETKAESIITVAAIFEKFTHAQMPATATALADIVKIGQLDSGEQAGALMASAIGDSRPEKLGNLVTGFATVANSAITTAVGQDPKEALREALSIYAPMTALDPQGASAGVAGSVFQQQINEVFNDQKRRQERQEKIDKLKLQIPETEIAIQRSQYNVDRYQKAADRFKPTDTSLPARDARLDLLKAQDDLKQANARLEKDRSDLALFVKQAEAASKDPGTFRTRLAAIRSSPELQSDFKANLRGEEKFKPFMIQALDANSPFSKQMEGTYSRATWDPKTFEAVKSTTAQTLQGTIAESSAKVETSANIEKYSNSEAQVIGAVGDHLVKTLQSTIVDWTTGSGSAMTQSWLPAMASQDTSQEFIQDAQTILLQRRRYLEKNDAGSAEQFKAIDTAIQEIVKLSTMPDFLAKILKTNEEQAKWMKEQSGVAKESADRLERLLERETQRAQPQAAVRNQVIQGTNQ